MISLEDSRWPLLTGGYRTPFDARPLLKRLETDTDAAEVWPDLWKELHHQGDVGEASFAAIPFLVDIYRKRGVVDWNTYAFVAIIELARNKGTNPDVPPWIADDYLHAIRTLAEVGTKEILHARSSQDVRAMLGVIAIEKNLRSHAELLVLYSEDELTGIISGI